MKMREKYEKNTSKMSEFKKFDIEYHKDMLELSGNTIKKSYRQYDKKDSGIYHMLQHFNNEIENNFHNAFNKEIQRLYQDPNMDKASPLLKLILLHFYKYDQVKDSGKHDFCISDSYKHAILSSFNKEIKTLDKEMS